MVSVVILFANFGPDCLLPSLFVLLQDNMEQRMSAQGDKSHSNTADDDRSMQGEEDDAGKAKGKTASSRQNEKLYNAEGILNTKMKRAEKKRRKKANKSSASVDAMDGDYDFRVDFFNKGSSMDVSDESD